MTDTLTVGMPSFAVLWAARMLARFCYRTVTRRPPLKARGRGSAEPGALGPLAHFAGPIASSFGAVESMVVWSLRGADDKPNFKHRVP